MEANSQGLSGPIMISIDVTYRCNFRCKHCFNGSGAPMLGEELSDDELLEIAKSVGVLQPNVVCFCGGEPLLRWAVLCDACKVIKSQSPFTQVNLVTNGSLVTEIIASRLNSAGITTVQVSIDGPNSEIHDWFRNKPGSFNHAINSVKILRRAGLNVVVASAPHKRHLLRLEETIDLCRQLGVSEIRMQPIMPLGRAIDNYNEIVPSYFEYQKLSRKLQELKYQSIDNGTVVEWGDPIDHLRKFSTSSFISNPSLGISAYGEITVSPYLPISVGCIKRHSLAVPFSKRLSQGFIGVDNPKRHGADPTFLLLLACVIVQELNAIKLDKRLSAATLALKENPKGIYISCFGGLSVRGIEGVLSEDDFTSAQCYTMLAYLALIDNHRATPSRLARIIWSDECIDNPNRAVRNVAARLRTCLKVIGLDFLIIYDNGFYSLNQSMGLITDVNLFENLCLRMKQTDSAEEKYKLYESAIELFTGDLLPRLSDNINFIPNITYYHGMFVELITSYVEACLSEGQYIYAHRAVKEALTFDPYNGRLNMYLIILIYKQSGVGTAKSYYMNTKDTLSDEQLYRIQIECPALMLG